MSDAAVPAATDPRTEADDLVGELAAAAEDLEAARERVAAVGEAELTDLAEAYRELTDLFDRYEEAVTGDGDFHTFIEFQEKVAVFIENLGDVRHRDAFEDVDDLLQQRRLTESDWRQVRDRLDPVREDVERLEERTAARERYREARAAVDRAVDDLARRVDDLEDLRRLGEADLDAPTDRLRDPVETYNDRVRAAFDAFRREAAARDLLAFVDATEAFPLVDFRSPPADLFEFVRSHEAGTEPVGQLLEYADYSRSKLAHYVDDADALKRAVSTQQTYLRRLDADPLTVDWPPPEAGALRFRTRELTSVVARFVDDVPDDAVESTGENESAAEGVLGALRDVRALPRETDYERLRDSAQARAQLGPDERERLASGAVDEELAACRDARTRLEEALEEHPPV